MTLGCEVEEEVQRHSFSTSTLYVCKSVSVTAALPTAKIPQYPWEAGWVPKFVRFLEKG